MYLTQDIILKGLCERNQVNRVNTIIRVRVRLVKLQKVENSCIT